MMIRAKLKQLQKYSIVEQAKYYSRNYTSDWSKNKYLGGKHLPLPEHSPQIVYTGIFDSHQSQGFSYQGYKITYQLTSGVTSHLYYSGYILR